MQRISAADCLFTSLLTITLVGSTKALIIFTYTYEQLRYSGVQVGSIIVVARNKLGLTEQHPNRRTPLRGLGVTSGPGLPTPRSDRGYIVRRTGTGACCAIRSRIDSPIRRGHRRHNPSHPTATSTPAIYESLAERQRYVIRTAGAPGLYSYFNLAASFNAISTGWTSLVQRKNELWFIYLTQFSFPPPYAQGPTV